MELENVKQKIANLIEEVRLKEIEFNKNLQCNSYGSLQTSNCLLKSIVALNQALNLLESAEQIWTS